MKLGVDPGPDGLVTVMSDAPTRDLNRLTGAALDAGIELDALQVLRPSLEDAYLELIGNHEAEAAG